MPDSAWKDDYYVRIYRFAKSGMSDAKIADSLGVTYRTFMNWKKKKPSLRAALKEARTVENGVETFKEYVLSKLPDKLQAIWNEIMLAETEPNHVKRVEALLAECGKKTRQRLFVYALLNANFNKTDACRMVNISKKTLDRWVLTDPDFAEMIEEIEWHRGNFFEGALVASVGRGEVPSIIFANKTYNADRGYGQKIKVEHDHSHTHTVVPIEDLDLPLEVRKQMLEAIRSRQEGNRPGGPRKALPEHVEDMD